MECTTVPKTWQRSFSMPGGFLVVRWLLGILLLAAAALKVAGLGVAAVGPIGIFSAPAFQVGVIGFEVFLALWLLSGRNPIGSWLLSLTAFTAFAGVNAYLGWIGQASCGCFGRLAVNPWYVFALDVGILVALVAARPDLGPLWANPRAAVSRVLAPAALGLAGVAAVLGVLAGVAYLGFGSPDAALAYLRGERISVRPWLVDVGAGAPGETRETTVELVNRTDQAVLLVGGTADCSCTALGDLPVTIPAKESRMITVQLRLPGTPGIFKRDVHLLADDQGMRVVPFRLAGRIKAPEQPSGTVRPE
jgi:hypothetical protein